MTLAPRYAVRSDVGLLREGNEDSAYAGPHLLAIADGMGGHAAGEVASSVAIFALKDLDRDDVPDDHMLDELAKAVAAANNTLHVMSVEDPSREGMGTTLTALLWSGGTVANCRIGGPRAYLLPDGEFRQITRDHTLVQSLVDDGRLTLAQAATHPQRSLVMRALQSGTEAEPDLRTFEAKAGDRYMLCSDGLSDVVTEATLRDALMRYADRDQAVNELIELAIVGGGFAAWRYTQSQYYVGTDGHQVIIYRGINQKIAGMSLSSVYQKTGIPLSQMPPNDKATVQSATPPGGLAEAQKTVSNIRHDLACQQYAVAYAAWLHKPRSRQVTTTVS